MIDKFKNIKGVIFDYGGTLDTDAIHWSEVIWKSYQHLKIPVKKESFRDAYVQGERYLATPGIVAPTDHFYQVLLKKSIVQIEYLIKNGCLQENNKTMEYPKMIAKFCDDEARETTKRSGNILKELSISYNLTLVTNFYGNIHSVLKDFDLLCYFKSVIESSAVGVRKPDPQIFSLGVEAMNLKPQEVVVIGDSLTNDIFPAQQAGCHTIWLEGIGWEQKKVDVLPERKVSSLNKTLDLL